jgi:hypothetical protein
MTFDDGVITLEPADAEMIGELLTDAATDGSPVRVAIDDGGVKLSVARGTWTPAIGSIHV